ncbi:EamA/RhaT family transporter [Mycetocola tolaasinivorans]|uniref:EamA/RhaT family transporter n=1 Tax=Mycetocola tolaasinivorans TaxID=76635 RepID=A0A3L6ZZU4_9MICO|nr:EamA family transporter [Mycetocola tolaasinivorans]RLP73215.1 EamA/RhaT family transporter [Mycetocola tolaasinivorans]
MTRHTVGVLAVLAAALLWGTTGTAASLVPEVGALAIGSAAMGIGGLLQALIALPSLRRSWCTLRAQPGMIMLGAVSVAIYPLAFYGSMRLGGVALGTVISLASAPLFAAALEAVADRTRLRRPWYLAAALGIAGSVLLCLPQAPGADLAGTRIPVGVLLGLLAGVTYALYSYAVRRLMLHGAERAASMGIVFGSGAILLLPVLLATGRAILSGPAPLAVTAYMALIPMFLGYVLFGLGLARIPASTATLLTLSEPAVAAVLAVWIVGEHIGLLGWIGLGVIGLSLLTELRVRAPASGRTRATARS